MLVRSGGAIDAGAEARVSATRTPRLVLVEGECGAGKTTLALHLLRRWCTNPACFRRATFDFVLHVDLRLLLLCTPCALTTDSREIGQ